MHNQRVGRLYVGMVPTRPFSPIQKNSSKLTNSAVLSLFRHICVSTNGYIPDSTLKVRKIHHYSDIQKFAKTAFLHLLLLLLLLLLQLARPTIKLVRVLTFIFGQNLGPRPHPLPAGCGLARAYNTSL